MFFRTSCNKPAKTKLKRVWLRKHKGSVIKFLTTCVGQRILGKCSRQAIPFNSYENNNVVNFFRFIQNKLKTRLEPPPRRK